jgi:hypothetical protein
LGSGTLDRQALKACSPASAGKNNYPWPGTSKSTRTGEAGKFTVRGVPVVYDATKQELVCKARRNLLRPVDGKVRLQILVDRTSLEIFGNDRLLYMPMAAGFAANDRNVALMAGGTGVKFDSLEVYELQSVWSQAR